MTDEIRELSDVSCGMMGDVNGERSAQRGGEMKGGVSVRERSEL